MNRAYIDTVRVLLDVAPFVFESPQFAMKGGTALNLFVQDLPRLSVDIDVVYVEHTPDRTTALRDIATNLSATKVAIERLGYTATILPTRAGDEAKMLVATATAQVKVEVNFVFRGTLLPVTTKSLTPATQELFTTDIRVPLLETAEMYGSKLVAAMDRQHPRDIYDVQQMLNTFGLPPQYVDCFVAYLAGHNRPIHEVLFAPPRPLASMFENAFSGMTREPVNVDSLISTQQQLLETLPSALTTSHRQFLLSLARAEPQWDLMPFAHLHLLPAIRWKLLNLEKLKQQNPKRFDAQHHELARAFDALP